MRRALKITAVVVAVLAVAAAALGALGERRTYDGSRTAAPAWARPCFERPPRRERTLLHRCASVRGRVVYVRRKPENDEVHLAIVARWRLLIVKLEPGADPPSFGSTRTFVGPLVRTHYRFLDLEEVQAFEFG